MQIGAIVGVVFVSALLVATIVDDFSTRKVLHNMALNLDALTAAISVLKSNADMAIGTIAAHQSTDQQPAIDALTSQVQGVADSLAAITAPKAPGA